MFFSSEYCFCCARWPGFNWFHGDASRCWWVCHYQWLCVYTQCIYTCVCVRYWALPEVMCLWSCDDVIDRTQVRRGPPDSSPQQTGTSRTVKRYPSSTGPIISNALPNGNGYVSAHGSEQRAWHGHRNVHSNTHPLNNYRPSGGQQQPHFNNAVSPAGRSHNSSIWCRIHLFSH